MDARAPRNGRVIEDLGTYDPMVPETDARAILKGERIDYWMSVGAKPTQKVGTLIKKYGTAGTHLDAQTEAIARLGDRRASSIASARDAASKVKIPDPVAAPAPEAPASEAPAEGDAPAAEATEEAAATEAPAEEAKAEAPAAEEAKAEAPAEEAPAAEEKPAE